MIFIDSNIPMYLVGADHPNKTATISLLGEFIGRGERLVTDVEVLQEILHRYSAIDRLDAVQPAFDLMTDLVDEVVPVQSSEVEAAKALLLEEEGAISARDALHAAVMSAHGIDRVASFDAGFDRISGLERLS